MKQPNFFIVGAQKCGTTALYTYLEQHPEIYMSPIKEPHYFGTDDTSNRLSHFRGDINDYLALFKGAKHETAIGEASPNYLMSKVAAQEIYDFNPDARIIISLRSPIDMMYSLYHHSYFMGDETKESFNEAVLPELEQGWSARTNRTYSYLELAHFSISVKRYIDVFPPQQIKIILFDDFKSNPTAVYQDILRFLGVDDSYEADFKVVNASKQIRSKKIQSFLEFIHLTPSHLRDAGWFVSLSKMMPFTVYNSLINLGKRLYATNARYPELSMDMREKLLDHLRPDIEALSRLIDRDLSHWLHVDQVVTVHE